MILTIPLQANTSLANVRYRWIVNGVQQGELSSGITQPTASFSEFRFDVVPPAGAEEIIAYDVTDLSNWNPGGYLNRVATTVTPSTLARFAIKSPTTTFRSVYEAILRRLGYNPKGDAVKEDVAQNILVHINDRVRFVWGAWDWPQINAVEWRALRTVWDALIMFSLDDELYYFGDGVTVPARFIDPPTLGAHAGYYKCILAAPVGTLPTNTTYFTPVTLKDRYIEYSQPFENPIGELLDAYNVNPRERPSQRTKILQTYPSSKGIDIRGGSSHDIIWIRYRIPCPQFTLRPFVRGSMQPGEPFYDPVSGNCFYYAGPLAFSPTGPLIPMPLFVSYYVKPAAFADCLLETAMEAKTKLFLAQNAEDEANQYLAREIDNLASQGQRLYYPAFPQMRRHYGRGPGVAAGAVPTEQFSGYG